MYAERRSNAGTARPITSAIVSVVNVASVEIEDAGEVEETHGEADEGIENSTVEQVEGIETLIVVREGEGSTDRIHAVQGRLVEEILGSGIRTGSLQGLIRMCQEVVAEEEMIVDGHPLLSHDPHLQQEQNQDPEHLHVDAHAPYLDPARLLLEDDLGRQTDATPIVAVAAEGEGGVETVGNVEDRPLLQIPHALALQDLLDAEDLSLHLSLHPLLQNLERLAVTLVPLPDLPPVHARGLEAAALE